MPYDLPPKEQREQNLAIYELRKYLTPDEQAELDKLTWSPPKERQRYRTDPVAFAREVLRMDLAPYQEQTLKDLQKYKRVAFCGPRGTGKSTTAAAAVLWFISVFEDCKVPTTASAWRQLIEFLWPEIHKWARSAQWWRVGLQVRPGKELLAQRLELSATRRAFAMASSNEAKVEGGHAKAMLMVFDEAKAIPDSIWDSAEGSLGTNEEAYELALSTPGDNIGRFFDIFHKREQYKHWRVVQVSLEDAVKAGRVRQDWADMMRRQWGEDSVMYKRHVLGIFAEDTGDTLISLSMIERANNRWHKRLQMVEELVIGGMHRDEAEERVWGALSHIGCDPARMGTNKTGWVFRHGDAVRNVMQTEKEDTMQTADRLYAFMQNNQSIANIDVNGLGAGVFDRLYQLWRQKQLRDPHDLKAPLGPINTANATKVRDKTNQLAFNRLRDYLWWHMRELLEDDKIDLPDDEDLTRDLLAPKWTTTASGKVMIESKEELKRRLDRSPDVGDALVMAYAPDIPPYKPAIGFL